MNAEFFIAQRIYSNKDGERKVSPPAIRVAIVSMALGIAVMILSVAVVIAFKKEVRNKVIGFGSHIQLTNLDSNISYETHPIAVSDTLLDELRRMPEIRHVQKFATKPGIIKTNNDSQGIILKGIDGDYDWNFFRRNLIAGEALTVGPDSTTNNVLISKVIADKLKLNLGDSFVTYFIQEPVRARRFTITGIYQTNFVDYDKLFIFSDIKQIRRLSGWDKDMVSGLELQVNDYDRLDDTALQLYYELQTRRDRLENSFYIRSIKDLNPMIFAWLDVLDMNVAVILLLMVIVAGLSMISGLLIIILEKANMIGILKALGENNSSIRKIFLYVSVFLIGKGLLWGNAIAFAVIFIQKQFGLFKLDPETYYVPEVPVDLNLLYILLINAGALIVTLLMLTGPSYLVAKILPAKTIRFE
ncbi:MAG: ABC transporter permease [Dysgonamonadaceae bacterium]|nr:ABC transporter permease [Dysgonamonadaceae bacterium]